MATGGLLSPSSPRRNVAAKPTRSLVSPSIMKWFGKGSGDGPMSRITKSPPKSPRRLNLILSPRKLPHELSNVNNLQGVKRKAPSPDNSPGKSKRMCARGENSTNVKKEPTSPVASRVLVPINNTSSPAGQAKSSATRKLFLSTPTKKKTSTNQLTFQSPTADLPNYVFNPQPRTPRASAKKNSEDKDKTPNWLIRMRLQKMADKLQDEDSSDGQPLGGAGVVMKTEPTLDGSSSQPVAAAPSTPSSSQKTPRQVKRAMSTSKSGKKRVSVYSSLFVLSHQFCSMMPHVL